MRIVELRAENIKRLKAVRIRPDRSLIQVTGKNGQGKSSLLDAIEYALGGKGTHPERPIRAGESHAEIVVELDDLVVKRTWNAKGNTYLAVESKDGAAYGSPQAVLDKLVGDLTFDPLAFSRMPPKDQVATLKRVAGLDTLFAGLDDKRRKLYEDRTHLGRTKKDLDGQLAGMPSVEGDVPDQLVGVHELSAKLSAAHADAGKNAKVRAAQSEAVQQVKSRETLCERLRRDLETAEEEEREAVRRADELTEAARTLLDPDVELIEKQMSDAEQVNELVRRRQARLDVAEKLGDVTANYSLKSQAIEEIDQQKLKALQNANLPVDGLTIDEECVRIGEFAFADTSSSEQLRVSVALGIAANPKLRVMLSRDGSLLDNESLALLATLAEEHDMQVFLERVSDGEPVGVVIEDGEASGEMALPIDAKEPMP